MEEEIPGGAAATAQQDAPPAPESDAAGLDDGMGDDPWAMEIPIENRETGEEVGSIPYSTLVDLYTSGKLNDLIGGAEAPADEAGGAVPAEPASPPQAPAPPEQDQQGQDDPAQQDQYEPILRTLGDSNLAQYVLLHRHRGFSDEQILEHLRGAAAPPAQAQQAAEPSGEQESGEQWQSEEEKRIAALERELQGIRAQQASATVVQKNDLALARALREAGRDAQALSKTDHNSLLAAVQAILPGVDLYNFTVSDGLAGAIVQHAFGASPAQAAAAPAQAPQAQQQRPQQRPAGQTAREAARRVGALPTMLPGTGGAARPGAQQSSDMPLTRDEKKQRLLSLFKGGGNG